MIKEKDVVTMYVPFPSISSELAVKSHMYICLVAGPNKELVKCQTFKPNHLVKNRPPYQYIVEEPNSSRNPFLRKTTIDCDKIFTVTKVRIDQKLLARTGICDPLFRCIQTKIGAPHCTKTILDPGELARINSRIVLVP